MINRQITRLALPNIISNITIPLLGMVDLVIIGRLGSDTMIGGLAIGTAVFNFLYWNFSFLRMGTSGFAAQAYGRRDLKESARVLVRSLTVAVAIALVILALQIPVLKLTLGFMGGEAEVNDWASDYFYMRIWTAPATLSMYALTGWFIGMQNSRTPMWIAIGINIVNIVFSLLLVIWLKMGIGGVALGTTIAQWSGVAMALFVLVRYYGRLFNGLAGRDIFRWKAMTGFFRVNRDIFLRTICLVAVFTYFTAASSHMGRDILAANTLMMQFFILFSYMMDGFAYAGEALAGRYYGAGNQSLLRLTVRALFKWGGMVALAFTAIYGLFARQILSIFTDSPAILDTAADYVIWAMAVPVAGFAAFLLDGIMVGITASKIMRNSMFIATVSFFVLYFALRDSMGNNALWLAFLVYLFMRGAVQLAASYKRILR